MKYKNYLNALIAIPALSIVGSTVALTSCSQYVSVVEITNNIFETNTYNSLDYQYANNYFTKNTAKSAGGCSSITKIINGHRIIGRNMDLNVTNKCAYIVRTNIPNKHRTLGIQYTFRDISEEYDVVKKRGITESFSKMLPFMCEDVINDQGLHIEVNLRDKEYWPNGEDKFYSTHTNQQNPDANRVYIYLLIQLIGLNCDSVESAKNYVNTLNIFSNESDWNFSFLVSDSNNKSSLLEIARNKVNWIDEEEATKINYLKTTTFTDDTPEEKPIVVKALAHTNFYVNKEWNNIQDRQMGLGRFDALQEGIDSVQSKAQMLNLMKKIDYSKLYDPDRWANSYDPRSELIGIEGHVTKDYALHWTIKQFKDIVLNTMPDWRHMTREQKAKDTRPWETTLCEVVDVQDKTINCRFFENDNVMYKINFYKTEKITQIED